MPKHHLQLTYFQFLQSKKCLTNTVIDKYIIYEEIGAGAYATVYRGMNDISKKQIAVKVLDLACINEVESSQKVRQIRKRLAKSESELMMKCNSPHIMKCYDVYENEDLKIMMIEYCNGGTLTRQLLKSEKVFTEKEAVDIIKQIIFGIAQMHKNNIIHRDLKAENIMFHNGILKIVDLGFSKVVPGKQTSTETIAYGTTLGTIITMAPEVMKRQQYGLKADIWSIGIILYEVFYGISPYEPMRAPEMYEQIISKNIFPKNGRIGNRVPSGDLLDFMKKILVINQKERLNWKQLLEHPLLLENEEQLPESFRVSRKIGQIKKEEYKIPQERTDEDYFVQMEEQICEKKQFKEEKKGTVQVKWITPKQSQMKKKQISEEDKIILQWVNETHLECLKTEFIFRNIILPIEDRKSLNFSKRQNIQFMYLLISRCFLNLSLINNDIIKKEHELVISLKENVYYLYKQVEKKWNHYCLRLKKAEDSWGSMIEDRFSKIFNSQKFEKKDTILVGVQMKDFTKEEQIIFTCNIIEEILKKEMDKKDIKIRKYLEKYEEINFITAEELKKKTLIEKIKQIIK